MILSLFVIVTSSYFSFNQFYVSVRFVSYLENESDDGLISTSGLEFRVAAVSAGTWTIRATGRSASNRHSSMVDPSGYCEPWWQMGSVHSRPRDYRESNYIQLASHIRAYGAPLFRGSLNTL